MEEGSRNIFNINMAFMIAKTKKEPITIAKRGRNEKQKHFHDGGNQEEHQVCRDWSLLADLPPFVSWTLWISRSTRWGHHSLPRPPTPLILLLYNTTFQNRIYENGYHLWFTAVPNIDEEGPTGFFKSHVGKVFILLQAVKEDGFSKHILDWDR